MSLGGNFGKPLFGSQTTGGASFGSASPSFGGPSPFGSSQSAPAFGSNPNVFQGGSAFGSGTPSNVTPQPSFGMPPSGAALPSVTPTPFGQTPPAFGNSGGNLGQPNFGQSNPSFFGSPSTFGNSQAAFASSSPFAATTFNQPSFGGSTTSFGGFGSVGLGVQPAQSAPSFGSSSAAFGAKNAQSSNPFSTSAFGNTLSNVSPGFGQGSVPGNNLKGTGNPKFQPVQEYDGGGVNVKYMSISRMPDYQDKSFEELRYEDYLLGKKNSSSLSTFQPAASAFGGSSINTGFGAPSSGFFSSSSTLSTPAFGASSSSFFSNTATAFGASQPSSVPGIGLSSSPFGQSSTGFGSGSSLFGGSSSVPVFGSQSAAPFQASTPFGLSSSTSSLFNSTSQKPFSGFGSSMPNQPVNSFGSTSIFGTTSAAPSFGASFGSATTASQPTLNLGSFGSSFGGNRFGSSPSSAASFGSSTFASSSPFASSFAFGADSSKSSASLFGGGLATSPQTAPTLFGNPSNASSGASLFGSFSSASNPTGSLFSPIGQSSNIGGFSASGLGVGGIGNSFSGLQSSSSGLFSSTPNFSFSAPAQQSSSFSLGNASLLGTQNTNVLNNAQGQRNLQFGTSQNMVSPDMNTPYGKSPIFEAASLSFDKSSVGNNRNETTGPATSLTFSNGSTIGRPSSRSVARIHARSLRSSLTLHSPLFETKRPVSVFSPEHFTLVETKNNSPSSTTKSPSIVRSDMKKLIITPRSEEKSGNTLEERKLDVREWSSPPEKKLSFSSSMSALPLTDEHQRVNGQVSSTKEEKTLELQEQSRVAKPTPLRSPGQYSGNHKSPSVYSSYREFYEENLSPEAAKLQSVPTMEEKNSAPILTKHTYFTSPSIETLRRMRDEDLKSIRNFTVGRKGIGEIQWLGETDVRNLDLDRLVIIEPREVVVYPNESEKPEIGRGLNRPAKVSLHKVWKIDKKTGEPLKDVASVTHFTAKLKSHCEKQGLTFLGYDATQGTWTFEVPHFSRYGLPDSEDELSEEEDILESSLNNTRSPPLNRVFDKEIERIHEDEAEDEFPTVEQMYIKEPLEETEPRDKHIDEKMYAREGQKSASFRTLLSSRKKPFKSNIFSSELGKTPEHRIFGPNSKLDWSQSNNERIDSDNLIRRSLKSVTEEAPNWTNHDKGENGALEDRMQETAIASREFPQESLRTRVTLKDSFLYAETEMKGDSLVFLGRSFRASIGPGFQVAFPILTFTDSNRSYTAPVILHRQTLEWEQSFIEKTLQIHFSSWKLSSDMDESNDSILHRRPTFQHAFKHHQVVVKTLQHLISEAGFSGNQHFELVLRLLFLLFVQNDDQETCNVDEMLLLRRNLSSWLQNYACTWSQEERNPTGDQYLYIFHLLTRGEVARAVKFCSESKNFRLGCMIAKCMQLEDEHYRSSCWKTHEFFCGHVPKDLDRIYSLLSGNILHTIENLSLSWYRTFGLHFWYGSGSQTWDGLKLSLHAYMEDWQNHPNVAPPVPPHIVITVAEQEQLNASRVLKNGLVYDACYVLLCIASELYPEHVQWMHLATPLAYGTDYDPLDAHKPWLLCEILSSITTTCYLDAKIVASFAIQLEMMHLYTWAFYILWSCDIFGKNNISRLKNVFIYWFPWIRLEQVQGVDGQLPGDVFLRQELEVPASWFEEAACIYSRYNFQFLQEAEHLCSLLDMEADYFAVYNYVYLANRAHQVVMSRAAPHMFLWNADKNHWTKLNEILDILGAVERKYPGIIPNYSGNILQEILFIRQKGRLSLETLEDILHKLHVFSSFVSSLYDTKQKDTTTWDLFLTCIFACVFRECWRQLLDEMDDSKFHRLATCLEQVQYIPHVPFSCKQFIHRLIETYRLYGISFTRHSMTRLDSALFDVWFPLVE